MSLSQATPADSEAAREVAATCEFCNEIVRLSEVGEGRVTENADTIADAMDIHYIDSCKMLTSCNACDKVIEINRLTTHMLNECEQRDKVKQCPDCSSVSTDLATHTCA